MDVLITADEAIYRLLCIFGGPAVICLLHLIKFGAVHSSKICYASRLDHRIKVFGTENRCCN